MIAHRGEHLQHPENTLPAIEAALRIGVDYVELDVRTSLDGHLVLMHDATVDARTDGQGEVRAMGFAAIRALDAGVKFDAKFAGTKVPEFDEALELLRGKCGLYLDWKDAVPEALVAALRRHKMIDQTVVYGGIEKLALLKKLEAGIRLMPEAVSEVYMKQCLERLDAKVIAFDRRDFRDELIALAIAAKADIFVDRLGPDDHRAAWLDAVKRGATGIQSDHPAELKATLHE